jgi:hypothetical protein
MLLIGLLVLVWLVVAALGGGVCWMSARGAEVKSSRDS